MIEKGSENVTIPTMVGLAEASSKTGVSYDYLRKLCLRNQIVHIRAGRRYLINLEKLVDYLNKGETRTEQAAGE